MAEARSGFRAVYGVRKTWKELRRYGVNDAGRERVAWLMRSHGFGDLRRGGKHRPTIVDPAADRACDLVCRRFCAAGPTSSGWPT
jgi:putative transposase